MTVANKTPATKATETGAIVPLDLKFRFGSGSIEASRVLVDGTVVELVEGVDYTLTGGDTDDGGQLIPLAAAAAGTVLRAKRATPRSQQTDYVPTDSFPSSSHEEALDRLTMIDQEQDTKIADTEERSFLVPDGEKGGAWPTREERKNRYPVFNNDGDLTHSAGTGVDAGLRQDLADTEGAGLAGFAVVGGVARTVKDKLRDIRHVQDFGAKGDGATDDRAAFAAADAKGAFRIPDGSYQIDTDISIASAARFERGAKIKPAAGVTITINGEIEAGAVQIFDVSAGGTIVINGEKNPIGWAEWWGLTASAPSAAADNRTRINAAIVALRETRLLARTYYTDGQLTVNGDNKRLIGSGKAYNGVTEGQITRILCTSATAHLLYVGATGFTSVADLPEGMHVEGLFLGRTAAPDITSSCAGVYYKWCKFSTLYNVKTTNSQYGFRFGGTVHCKIDRPHAIRAAAGTGGADTFTGLYVDGHEDIGLNGSNASLYLNQPVVEGNAAIPGPGIRADNWNTDLFIDQPETSFTTTGIEIEGNSDNAAINARNVDVTIIDPKLDSFAFAGIYVHGMNQYGSVEIVSGYYGAKEDATAAILVDTNYGAVNVLGGQVLLTASTSARGIRINAANNVTVVGTIINEATNAAVEMDTAKSCKIAPRVKNYGNVCQAAVRTYNAQEGNVLEAMVSGGAGKVSYGYQVIGTADARNEYRMTGVNSDCIAGGSGNKLLRNGAQVTVAGASGTNVVAGVMA